MKSLRTYLLKSGTKVYVYLMANGYKKKVYQKKAQLNKDIEKYRDGSAYNLNLGKHWYQTYNPNRF